MFILYQCEPVVAMYAASHLYFSPQEDEKEEMTAERPELMKCDGCIHIPLPRHKSARVKERTATPL